jgi:hypothetical protein
MSISCPYSQHILRRIVGAFFASLVPRNASKMIFYLFEKPVFFTGRTEVDKHLLEELIRDTIELQKAGARP